MKRLLILPIISLIGAAGFCTGMFSEAEDAPLLPDAALMENTQADTSLVDEYLQNITTVNTEEKVPAPAITEAAPVPDKFDDPDAPETTPPRFTVGGWLTGTENLPATEDEEEPVETTAKAPETTPAPVTTTKAPVITKAPVTTQPPVTTAPPVTTVPPVTTAPPATDTPAGSGLTPQQQKIVNIAIGEIGVTEKAYNNVKYNTWYFGHTVSDKSNSGVNYAWCGTFVSWCARQAGVPESAFPTLRSAGAFRDWFNARGQYTRYSSSYTPKPGDLIFIDWGGRRGTIDHVGLVVSVDNGIITTVEGNYSNKVSCNTYALNSKYIVGYASPAYN